MINKAYIENRLIELKFNPAVLYRYEEGHRFYHTLQHLYAILEGLKKIAKLDDTVLFLACIYHDAVYNPTSSCNEEDSAALFEKEAANASITQEEKKEINQLILETKLHKASTERSAIFQQLDLAIFNADFAQLMEYEHQIFKEFQFVDYSLYKQKRIEVLNHFNENGKLNALIEYVKCRMPRIGVFAGSFNPFHKGHYNVLQKAEKCFDKVIVAFGVNPEKNQRSWSIPKTIQNRQITEYDGLLTDYINSIPYEVIVIRGLRNSTDFQYEQNQYRYIQELKPDINIVSIFCDKEFEHISSSGIRTLEKYNKHNLYLLD